MFGLSSFELAMIALVALLVLGPKRLPKAARTAGMLVRKAQQAWFNVRDEIERELTLEELKTQMRAQEQELKDVQASITKDVRGLVDQTVDGLDVDAPNKLDDLSALEKSQEAELSGAPNDAPSKPSDAS